MAKEQPKQKTGFETPPAKLLPERIKELLIQYPGVVLDDGKQHFVVKHMDEEGKWLFDDMIPVWEKIPQEDRGAISIEQALDEALAKKE